MQKTNTLPHQMAGAPIIDKNKNFNRVQFEICWMGPLPAANIFEIIFRALSMFVRLSGFQGEAFEMRNFSVAPADLSNRLDVDGRS